MASTTEYIDCIMIDAQGTQRKGATKYVKLDPPMVAAAKLAQGLTVFVAPQDAWVVLAQAGLANATSPAA